MSANGFIVVTTQEARGYFNLCNVYGMTKQNRKTLHILIKNKEEFSKFAYCAISLKDYESIWKQNKSKPKLKN